MIVKFPNGRAIEGFLLARDETSMRVALEGSEDAVEFFTVRGSWVSENLEPVDIRFEWQRRPQTTPPWHESDFVCPKDLAAELIRQLPLDSDKEERRRPKCFAAG